MSEDGRPQGRPFSATRGESFRKQATGCGIAKMRNLMRLWTVAVLLLVWTRRIGRDGKWQVNLYDPDGIRAEPMEFQPSVKPCCSPFLAPSPTRSEERPVG